jgi:hypothetical protein
MCLCYVEPNNLTILWIYYKLRVKKRRDLFKETSVVRIEGLEKTARTLSEGRWPFNRDLKPVLPEFNARMLVSTSKFCFAYLSVILIFRQYICVK